MDMPSTNSQPHENEMLFGELVKCSEVPPDDYNIKT